jgi:PAS domain S-box-containing protein
MHDLRAEAGFLESVVAAPADAVLLAGAGGEVVAFNEVAPALCGRSGEALLGLRLAALFAEQSLADCLARPGRAQGVPLRRGDGSEVQVELVACPLQAGRGEEPLLVLHLRDLAGRRRLEDQLLQVQRLEELGRLSGGVAHDFNNLLTVILSAVEGAAALVGSGSPAADDLVAIEQAARHASQVTRQLLAFARRSLAHTQLVDADELLRTLSRMLGPLLGKAIRVEIEVPDEELPVQAEPVQLEQLFLNLAMNAREAMGGRGLLTLSARGLDAAAAGAFGLACPLVLFSVRDTGCGMDEAVRARLFEAFFTTKARGTGTGIGLAACKGIVQRLGGTIQAQSAPGSGTTFLIALPRRERPRAVQGAGPAPLSGLMGPHGRRPLTSSAEAARSERTPPPL